MKIFQLIKKDFKEFYRESTTFKIVTLSPILIIFILGIVFSKGMPETINLPMKIGICSDGADIPNDLVGTLKAENWVDIEEVETDNSCEPVIKESVMNGNLKGGIVIPEGFLLNFEEGESSTVRIFVDNSLVGIDGIIRGYFWRVIQKYSEGFKDDPSGSIQSDLSNSREDLSEIRNSIKFSSGMSEINANVQKLNEDVQSIDVTSQKSDISSSRSQLQTISNQIDSTITEIQETRNDIQNYKTTLHEIRQDLVDYDQQIIDTKDTLETVYSAFCGSIDPMAPPPPPGEEDTCGDIEQAIDDLDDTHNDLQAKIALVDSTIADLEETDKDLAQKQSDLQKMKGDVDSSETKLVQMSASIDDMIQMQQDSQGFAEDFAEFEKEYSERQNEMSMALGSFDSNLAEAALKMSLSGINPIDIDMVDTFEGRTFLDFMMPILISFLAMFIPTFLASTTIIAEKSSGTLTRNMLTPISLATIIGGKMLSIIFVGFIEIMVVMIIGIAFYGITMSSLYVGFLLSVFLSLFAFTVIGMFIGLWSDSGITAVLISVTFLIVMMFISGMVVPNELLPRNVVTIGTYFPVSNVISLVKGMLVYNRIEYFAISYLSLLSVAGLLLCILSIKTKV